MRLLVISNLYPPDALGGYEVMCAMSARRWTEHGHDVTVLTRRSRSRESRAHASPWARRLLPTAPRERAHGGRLIEAAWQTRSARIVERVTKQVAPDLVVTWGIYGIATAAIARLLDAGIPTLAIVADYCLRDLLVARHPALAQGPLARRYDASLRAATAWTGMWRPLCMPRRWVFVSQAVQRTYEHSLGPLPGTVVHWGIDAPAEPPPHRVARETLRVGALGRLVPEKGLHTLIAAAALLARRDSARAPVVSIRGPVVDADYHARLSAAAAGARAAGASVTVEPPIARAEVSGWMAEQDCIAVPSEWEEPLALVVLEGMSAARAVVSTRCGGTPEIIEDGVTGLLHEPGDVEGLAAALERLRAEPGLAARLGLQGWQLVRERFRPETAAAALDAALEAAVEAATHRRP